MRSWNARTGQISAGRFLLCSAASGVELPEPGCFFAPECVARSPAVHQDVVDPATHVEVIRFGPHGERFDREPVECEPQDTPMYGCRPRASRSRYAAATPSPPAPMFTSRTPWSRGSRSIGESSASLTESRKLRPPIAQRPSPFSRSPSRRGRPACRTPVHTATAGAYRQISFSTAGVSSMRMTVASRIRAAIMP